MQGRNAFLDLLRAIAVLLVMVHHLPPEARAEGAFADALVRGGYCGVDLFFVLSGYLISGLLMSEYDAQGSIQIRRFLVRRAFKLYPAFWVMIAATVAARLFVSSPEVVREMWPRLASELLFVQNYFPGLWSHTWTLGVEEHFYIALACAFALMSSPRGRPDPFFGVPWLFAFAAVVCLWLRTRMPPIGGEADWFSGVGTHLRADSLMFGVFLRWSLSRFDRDGKASKAASWAFLLAGTCVMSLAFLETPYVERLRSAYGPTVLYLGAGLIVMASRGITVSPTGLPGFAARVGADSYSIYLWHLFVFSLAARALQRLAPHSGWFGGTFLLVASIIFGMFMSRLVEHPVLRLRDRLFPSRST